MRRYVLPVPLALALLVALLSSLAQTPALCAAQPLLPRSEMLSVDQLRPGMKGLGKSVFKGTRVEDFGVTVLGVLQNVDFDGDIILIRIDSGAPVSQGFGVVSGMSGSPIYVNGKLIGALAYAWPFAKTPIAGVTPIAQMLEAYQPGSSPVPRSSRLRAAEPFDVDGRRIDRAVVLPPDTTPQTARQSPAALVPISTPVLVTGLSPRLLEDLRKAMAPFGLVPLAGGGSMGSFDTHIEPGQALGARLVGGDLDLTAVGTVTYVKDDVVIAFGHPLAGLGTTDIPLVAAYVHGVMPSSEISFKLASGGQILGHITEDRPFCIGGRLGGQAALVAEQLAVTDKERGVVREYNVEVIRNRSLTSMLLVSVLGSAIDSVGPPAEGTTRARFSLEAEGLPPLERENTYTVEEGGGILSILFGLGGGDSATGELSQVLDVLQSSEFGEAKLKRLRVAIEVSKARRTARLEDVSLSKSTVRAGEDVDLVITLRTSSGGLVQTRRTLTVPANCPPGRVRIGVAGGRSAEGMRSRLEISDPRPASMAQMVEQMLRRPSNDELVIETALPTVGIEAAGHAFTDLPAAAIDLLRSAPARPLRVLRDHLTSRSKTEWVASGSTVLMLTVEGEEKDKGGRPPSPEYRPPRYDDTAGGFAGLFSDSEYGVTVGLRLPAAEAMDPEAPPPMPSWEEVQSVGETEITIAAESTGKPAAGAAARSDAVGRVAKVWRLSDPKQLLAGKAEGTALPSRGGLMLAPHPAELARVESHCLWPVAVASDGTVYTGSWVDAALRKTTPDGKTTTALETKDAGIQAIAIAPDGAVYAAGVPDATIYRLREGEEPAEFCHLHAQNVWALLFDPSGTLWAATGAEGQLYRIAADGTSTLAFTAADRHLTCLAVGSDGTIYLGTSPLGKVYALAPDGSARSLYEVDDAAVQSIAFAGGNVFIGTSPKARVLKLGPDGAAAEVMKAKGRHVLALLARPDGTVLAATGPRAEITALYPDGSSALLYHPDATFPASLAADPAGDVYLTTADTGRLIELDSTRARTGTYTSAPCDAGASARWGAVRWQGDAPDGTSVTLSTRSGATAHPDATWSDWQPVPPAPGAAVGSPANRFLQCRVDLQSTGPATPFVDAIEFRYLPVNRAPEVRLTAPAGDEVWSGTQTVRWSGRDPDGDKLVYQVYYSGDRRSTWTRIESPAEETSEESADEAASSEEEADSGSEAAASADDGTSDSAPKPAAKAGDPTVRHGARRPTPLGVPGLNLEDLEGLAEDMDMVDVEDESAVEDGVGEEPGKPSPPPSRSTSIKWKTTDVPDGTYWLKVVGSDEQSNPADPRREEAVSRSFVVDNTAPEIIVDRRRKDDDAPPISVSVYDRGTYITSADLKIDKGEWLAALPADGIFDSQWESILLDAARLPAGAHQITLRARDAAGNVTTASLRYTKG